MSALYFTAIILGVVVLYWATEISLDPAKSVLAIALMIFGAAIVGAALLLGGA